MGYTTDIPVSGDSLGGSRDRIRTNFQLISSVFGQNHQTFGQSDQGIHKYVVMPEADTFPDPDGVPGTNANAAALFVNPGTNPVESNLFIRGESDGHEWQITSVDQVNYSTFGTIAGANSSGWTFLPGGMVLQYGIRTVAASGTATTITFPKTFTNAASVYSITIGNVTGEGNSPGENNQFIKDGSVTDSTFQIVNSSDSSARKVYWMAIGK
jgi:hypothetical protein